ncbi:MAG: hypothetical protein IJT58_02315 [Synergistaceae bacterium]|nr:hypothetical protein [Synergistaceae bacterium]
MKKYSAPLVTNNMPEGFAFPAIIAGVSIAKAFAAGVAAAAVGSALSGDKIIAPGLAGLEPCMD